MASAVHREHVRGGHAQTTKWSVMMKSSCPREHANPPIIRRPIKGTFIPWLAPDIPGGHVITHSCQFPCNGGAAAAYLGFQGALRTTIRTVPQPLDCSELLEPIPKEDMPCAKANSAAFRFVPPRSARWRSQHS